MTTTAAATEVRVFANSDSLSADLDAYIEKRSRDAIAARGVFYVAVSGGSLPRLLSKSIVHNERLAFDKWHIFFADERCVPLDHPDSNYLALRKALLDRLPPSKRPRVHTVNHQHDPAAAATDYERQLEDHIACVPPRFDLVLLGMGPDGHCCSLFPGHPLLSERYRWVVPIEDSPKPPSQRITLTLPVLRQARQRIFVATGEAKRDMLFNILHRPELNLPCQLAGPGAWFVDDAAAARLPHSPNSKL